jgi:hypothetical protein
MADELVGADFRDDAHILVGCILFDGEGVCSVRCLSASFTPLKMTSLPTPFLVLLHP